MRVVFFLEENSMEEFLNELLGRFFPNLTFLCVVYEGWHDLERSVPRTLRSWGISGDRFMIVRDRDGHDCHVLKQRIVDSCTEIGRNNVLVRILCQELEGWYLGDFTALAEAYDSPQILRYQAQARFRNPDSVRNPSDAVATMVGPFRKIEAARRLGSLVDVERNQSQSFQVFVEGVRRLVAELG